MFTAEDVSFLQTLGEGSLGRVALVHLKEEVASDYVFLACKIIKKCELVNTRSAENVKREIDILNRLHGYAFFPKLYSVFEFYDRLCILMEFCNGGEMFRWIRLHRNGLSFESIRFHGAEILLALRTLRTLNILYRDLKSENILLTSRGHVRIADFGLSICTESKAWMYAGTSECMAPEVIKHNGYGPESDLWSFGVLLYEMKHHRTPFAVIDGPSTNAKVSDGVLNKEPVFKEGLDQDYVDLIQRLLCKNPQRRLGYNNIEEVMMHPFFCGVDWERMELQDIDPPAAPGALYEGDTKNFDFYKETITSFDFPPMSVLKRKNPAEFKKLFGP